MRIHADTLLRAGHDHAQGRIATQNYALTVHHQTENRAAAEPGDQIHTLHDDQTATDGVSLTEGPTIENEVAPNTAQTGTDDDGPQTIVVDVQAAFEEQSDKMSPIDKMAFSYASSNGSKRRRHIFMMLW